MLMQLLGTCKDNRNEYGFLFFLAFFDCEAVLTLRVGGPFYYRGHLLEHCCCESLIFACIEELPMEPIERDVDVIIISTTRILWP
jgi:hypothetical protein